MEAKAFLKNGHFAADLGNSMPLAMANLLCLPIVVMTQMDNLPVLPITPRDCMQCMPIFIAFDQSSAGHYDAVTQITHLEPSCGVEKSVEVQSKSECCRWGQGAKKEKDIVSCDQLKKDASASRRLEVVLTTLTALVVKTHMEKKIY